MTCHGKRVTYSSHARKRMRERYVTRAQVNEVLCEPDLTKSVGFDNRMEKIKRIDDRDNDLIVIVKEIGNNRWHVVSVHWWDKENG